MIDAPPRAIIATPVPVAEEPAELLLEERAAAGLRGESLPGPQAPQEPGAGAGSTRALGA